MSTVDPIEGRFGQVLVSGWISETPDTGEDGAYMLLTTPDQRAHITLPLVAEVLGLKSAAGSMTMAPAADTWVSIDGTWATLHAPGGEKFARPMSEEWASLAGQHSRVVLAIGYAPARSDEGPDEYMNRVLPVGKFVVALVPVR
ncbi:hypothetical protein [Sphaerisporangium aureirubrum]|uniref:Uncharacterized protein n=1 Tax=Sphaerisporangium aureirubrum TaxID=1544736 RepID=A0ABW1NC10_9ACTN